MLWGERTLRFERTHNYTRSLNSTNKPAWRDHDERHNYLDTEAAELQASFALAERPFEHVVTRLDSLLMVLKSCKGEECHSPWNTLHPKANIKNLKDALHVEYDAFYAEQPKVSYSSCQLGYLVDEEGPQHVKKFGDSELLVEQGRPRSFRYQGELSWWT